MSLTSNAIAPSVGAEGHRLHCEGPRHPAAARSWSDALAEKHCLIVEDHAPFTTSLVQTLEREGARGVRLRGFSEAQKELAARRWDLVIVELSSPDRLGARAARYATSIAPRPGILVVATGIEPCTLTELHSLGAITVHEAELGGDIGALARLALTRALRMTIDGAPAAHLAEHHAPTARFAASFGFTLREREVFTHLVGGLAPKEIASRLSISHVTVRRHTENLCRKCGGTSQRELLSAFARTLVDRDWRTPDSITLV